MPSYFASETGHRNMLWPIVLPFLITLGFLATIVVLLTMIAPFFHWNRGPTLAISVVLACVAFIPSCTGIMRFVDTQRFGLFEYKTYADVGDFRVERFLPPEARDITLQKRPNGHRAKYTISEADLTEYVDGLWNRYGKQSAVPRAELHEGAHVTAEAFEQEFGDLGWPPLEDAVTFHSPVEDDRGGAEYYYDRKTGTAYHRAGYW